MGQRTGGVPILTSSGETLIVDPNSVDPEFLKTVGAPPVSVDAQLVDPTKSMPIIRPDENTSNIQSYLDQQVKSKLDPIRIIDRGAKSSAARPIEFSGNLSDKVRMDETLRLAGDIQSSEQVRLAAEQQKAVRRDEIISENISRAKLGLPPLEVPDSLMPAKTGQQEIDANEYVNPSAQFAPGSQPVNPLKSPFELIASGVDQQKGAIANNAALQAFYGNEVVKQLDEAQKADLEIVRQIQQRQETQQMAVQEAMGKLDKQINEVREMKIDPDRFYKRLGTGGTILAAIAGAMGTFGATLGGGQNAALAIINNAIDRDIEAQRSEIQSKKDGVVLDQNALARMQSVYQDEIQALNAAKMMMLENAKLKVQSLAQQTSNQTAKQNAAQLIGQLDTEMGKYMAEFQIKAQKAAAEKSKLPSEAAATRRSEILSALNGVRELQSEADNLSGLSFVSQLIPGTAADKFDKRRNVVAEGLGQAFKGSKEGRDAAIERWKELLGDSSDASFGTLKDRLRIVEQQLQNQLDIYDQNLGDVGKYGVRSQQGLTPPGGTPKGFVQ